MIGFMPRLYPDELVYSLFARFFVHSGYSKYVDIAEKIYRYKNVRPLPEFINALTEEAKKILLQGASMEYIIEKHTMFPVYARFIPMERRQKGFKALINADGSFMNYLYIPNGNRSNKYLRWCPRCVEEDREKYGETYWHRAHQIAGVNICVKHRRRLCNSSVITGKGTPSLIAAEQEVIEYAVTDTEISDIEISLSEYMLDVFNRPMDMDNEGNAGLFINSRIDTDKYLYANSVVRKISEFYSDYCNYYAGITDKMNIDTMKKIWNGDTAPMHYICQLAIFERISVAELISFNNATNSRAKIFKRIALELGEDENTVIRIGEAVLKACTSTTKAQLRMIPNAERWNKMDEELFPIVKAVIESIYGYGEDRPHRVCIKAVCSKMNFPDKRFDNLPRCRDEIMRWHESQEHYWAREVVWAINLINKSNEPMNWKHIRNLTNMRKVNLEACLPELKDMVENEIYNEIANMI